MIRLSFAPFEEPLRHTTRLLDGEYHTFVYPGAIRAEMDTPQGPFVWLSKSRHELTDDQIEELRPLIESRIRAAYKEQNGDTDE